MFILMAVLWFSDPSEPSSDYEQTPKVMSFVLEKRRFVDEIKKQLAKGDQGATPDITIERKRPVHVQVIGRVCHFLKVRATSFKIIMHEIFFDDYPDFKKSSNLKRKKIELMERGFLPGDFEILREIFNTATASYGKEHRPYFLSLMAKREQVANADDPMDEIQKLHGFVEEEIEFENYDIEKWADYVFSKLPVRLQRILWVKYQEQQESSGSSMDINIGSYEENKQFLAVELPKQREKEL